ncbi:hypothetical protein HZF24_03020 [Sedimentibacter hydroxybenzoicus DSM 7310]|uniref:Uncharacterized protein n=1 Tax=Sedimentibacter hydroxybenzoicus DSM 7310 TaxID=1123245 RepID=A0A974BHA3_SEDHY|nr:hypothetical protein [Sedimentibacter hydroxybenzoicus]NYB73107.1 hypothetical protein [Sedimentibacter hydroxybenzoicus DSM 7310]
MLLLSGIMNLIAAICFIVYGLNDGMNIIWFGIALIFISVGAVAIGSHIRGKKS